MRSSRSLKWEELENDNETSGFDVIFQANVAGNFYENTNASSGKDTHDITTNNDKIISATLGKMILDNISKLVYLLSKLFLRFSSLSFNIYSSVLLTLIKSSSVFEVSSKI